MPVKRKLDIYFKPVERIFKMMINNPLTKKFKTIKAKEIKIKTD
jgi:hypothetical protein